MNNMLSVILQNCQKNKVDCRLTSLQNTFVKSGVFGLLEYQKKTKLPDGK